MSNRDITAGKAIAKPTLPPAMLSVAAAIFIIAGFGPNIFLVSVSIAVLLLGSWLLWRPGESPILLFVFAYQWLQASVKAFHGNWLGVDVEEITPYGGDIHLAIILTLLGLVVLALGMRLGAGPWRSQDGMLVRNDALRRSPQYWFRLYIAALLIATLVQTVTWIVPGLSQPLLALASLKWAFYWMLAYATFVQPGSNKQYWLVAFGLEMLLGIGGYFADFKFPLIFTLLAAIAAGVRLSGERYLALASIAAIALTLGVVWTAVKPEYRLYLSAGEKEQIVTVGYVERIAKLSEMVRKLDSTAMAEATDEFFQRLSYVDFFGRVLSTVPAVLPHENGALWWDAVSRPFMPRLFFPDKEAIDDSDRTNRYTGLRVAGAAEGTSISIGYMGESYIDFGAIGMMTPIFALGLLLGSFYRWTLGLDPSQRFLGMALATATIYQATFLESSITKTFGGLVVTMLVSWMILRFIAPRYLSATRTAVQHQR